MLLLEAKAKPAGLGYKVSLTLLFIDFVAGYSDFYHITPQIMRMT